MSLKLVEVLSASALSEILKEDSPVEDVVEGLFNKGNDLCQVVSMLEYPSWDDFKKRHAANGTELTQLEGSSTLSDSDVVVLLKCPMADEISKLFVDGKPPAFFKKIVDEYMDQNPGSNAILHPGCIAHQVARLLIVKNLNISGTGDMNYCQLACRSGASGKIVYDENGLTAAGMSKEQAGKLVDGYGCLYAITRANN